MQSSRPAKRPFGLTLAGLWTGSYSAVMAAFFGVSLLGTYAPTDFATAPITTNEMTTIIVNLVAGLCGVIIGFALLRRWRWGYWLALLFHMFTIVNVVVSGVQLAALSSDPLRTVLLIGSLVVSIFSLFILIYLGFGRKRLTAR